MIRFTERHKAVGRRIHTYFTANSPGVKYLQWDQLTDIQKQWWYYSAVAALRKDDPKVKIDNEKESV